MSACTTEESQRHPRRNYRNRDRRPRLAASQVARFVALLYASRLHAKRVVSLANGVIGVLFAAGLGIHTIGRALAEATGRKRKHAVKQIDRLLSNSGVQLAALFPAWIRYVVGARNEIVVALDWTEFEADDHSTICAYLVTRHGRATPLVWKTVRKSTMAGKRGSYEIELLDVLGAGLPGNVKITVLADRGFGDQELYKHLAFLGWDYVIRFREGILVTSGAQTKPAAEWVPASGHAKILKGAAVTRDKTPVPAVVVKHAKGMKEAWCLATSLIDVGAAGIVKLYSRRFTIEETFRDEKDIRFGMGLSSTHIRDAGRRDRLLLLGAMAHALLVLLGEAGERCGLDRTLKTNTSPKRQLSLYNQGTFWFRALPNMHEEDVELLLPAYDQVIREHEFFREVYGVI
jgi:hypothetical protein